MLLNAPNWLFTYPGATIFFVGIVLIFSALLKINIGYLPGIHSMIAGSLLIITGYQIAFFGFFAKIRSGGNLPRILTLERGATIGVAILICGLVYALLLVMEWVMSGFKHLPSLEHDIIAFTLIALGLETYFSSFMLSILAERL